MCRSGNRRGVQHQRVCQGQAGEYCGHSQCQVEEWVCPREPTQAFGAQIVLGEIPDPSQTLGEGLDLRTPHLLQGNFPSPSTALKRGPGCPCGEEGGGWCLAACPELGLFLHVSAGSHGHFGGSESRNGGAEAGQAKRRLFGVLCRLVSTTQMFLKKNNLKDKDSKNNPLVSC